MNLIFDVILGKCDGSLTGWSWPWYGRFYRFWS